jgi:hypothetical protein
MSFDPAPVKSEGIGLMMSQTASDSLLSDPHSCLNVGLAVGVSVDVGVGVAAAVAVTVGFGAAFIATPLFQTNLLPDLTQVYLIPAEVLVCPCLVHLVPGLTAAVAIGVIVASKSALTDKSTTFLRIEQL